MEKLKYHRVEGRLQRLLKTYLKDRFQFVEVQNKQSKIVKSPSCSVVQGSKLSGLLYSIYTNEVAKLHHLLDDEEWLESKLKIK